MPQRIALISILILAAALRIWHIGQQSLWFDEAATVHIVEQPAAKMMALIRTDERTPPLHYFIVRAWIGVFGDSETSVRLPSALAGVGAVWILYLLTARVFGDSAGLIAALLLAMSRYQILYSQEARAYTLMLMLGLWSCYLFLRLLEAQTRRLEFLYVIVTALLLYAHLYGVFTLAAQHVAYAIYFRREKALSPRRWFILNLAVLALFSPWIPTAIVWTRSVSTGFWVEPMTLADIASSFQIYAGSWFALVLLTGFAICGARRGKRIGSTLLMGVALIPVVVPVILSILTKPTFTNRYGITAPAALFALAAGGIVAIPRCRMRTIAIALTSCFLFSGRALVWNKPDWRGVASYITSHMRPSDVAVVNRKSSTYLYDYYIRQPNFRRIGFDSGAIPVSVPLPPDQQVWLILHSDTATADEILSRAPWRVLSRQMFGPIEVLQLQDTSNEPAASQPTAIQIAPTSRSSTTPASSAPSSANPRPTSSRSE